MCCHIVRTPRTKAVPWKRRDRTRGETVKVSTRQIEETPSKSTGRGWPHRHHQRWFLGEAALDSFQQAGFTTGAELAINFHPHPYLLESWSSFMSFPTSCDSLGRRNKKRRHTIEIRSLASLFGWVKKPPRFSASMSVSEGDRKASEKPHNFTDDRSDVNMKFLVWTSINKPRCSWT